MSRLLRTAIILCCAILLGLLTVYLQLRVVTIPFLEQNQAQLHQAVMRGNAGNPWQYRVLAEYLVEGFLAVATRLQLAQPVAAGFIAFRVCQNLLLFLLAALYYRRLGLGTYPALIGLSLLAWGMSFGSYGTRDLKLDTYFDISFYLLAGLIILERRYLWLIPLVGVAALNRETSGLIPFMLLAVSLQPGQSRAESRRAQLIAAGALVTFLAVFLALRLGYGRQQLLVPFGHPPGWVLLKYNLTRAVTWVQLLATLGIIPLLALANFRHWPGILRAFFWVIVPLWFPLHFVVGVAAETRLFLVPQALIFIPGALLGIGGPAGRDRQPCAPPLDLSASEVV